VGVPGRKPNMGAASAEVEVFVPTGQVDALPGPPEELTEGALSIWSVVLPDLISNGVYRPSDAIMLVELCESLATAQGFRRQANGLMQRLERQEERCAELLEAGDLETLQDAEKDAEVLSGRLKRARSGYLQNMKLVMSIAGEFGISPVARLRLGLMRIQGGTLLAALGGDDE
jgi:phage terminase small subunit